MLRLLELVQANYNGIHPETHVADANKRQNAAWDRIVTILNAEYVENVLTVKQVKECFKGLKKSSKDEIISKKKYFLN